MRLFIAINIDEKIRQALNRLQQQLQEKADIRKSDVKWVNPELVHLTLKFLGEVKDAHVVDVCNIVEDVANRHDSFELAIESVGYFGHRIAKVLWVGTGSGKNYLHHLQNDLEELMAAADWPQETRDFAGHLTLCRIRNLKAGVKLAKISAEYKELKLGTIAVDSVFVYQSQLTPAGPVYTVVGNYNLR